jgi:hypothetical protein
VLGEVQTGHRRVADLPALEATCLDAYMAGVAAEGDGADAARTRRSHAVLMTVFTALSAVPVEPSMPTRLQRFAASFAARASVARFVLDLLDDTRRSSTGVLAGAARR